MRLRNVRGARDRIASDGSVITEPAKWKGRWRELFGNGNPIHAEVGMGKGKFLLGIAAARPETSFVGIEKYSSVLIRAVERREMEETAAGENLGNMALVRMDAEEIEDAFGEGEVSRIYLNFPDPWPKGRHAKRRLTSGRFLARYGRILAPGGDIVLKTDNRELFDFSVREAREAGWALEGVTYDLHHSPFLEGNVMTEYEERFVGQGKPICRLAMRPGGKGAADS